MRVARNSVGYRILLPIFVLVAGLTVALLLLIQRITRHVSEDYHRFTVTASASHITTILELAAAELTAARLTDNPVVVEAKQGSVRESIARFWSGSGLDGTIAAADGTVILSRLSPTAAAAIAAHREAGYFTVRDGRELLHCFAQKFPLWGWTVATTVRHSSMQFVREELVFLLPILALGALALAAGLSLVLWRNLKRPVAGLVAAVEEEREAPPTGIEEFDGIGRAVNEALARVRERTAQLTGELGQRRRAEAALREKEAHVRLLLDSTAEGIYGVDTAGVCTFCNPACLRMLGLGREEELLGGNVHALIHHSRPDGTPYAESECRIYRAYREQRELHVDDEVFWRPDGSSFPVEYWSHPVLDAGVVTGAVVAFADITERRRSEKFIRDILETVDEGFLVVDRSYRIVLANRALGVLVGAPLERIVGSTCHEIFHRRPEPCAADAQPCLLRPLFATGKAAVGEHTHLQHSGGEIRVEMHAYPVFDAAGEASTAIVTVTDVTEKAGLEQQLRQAQKMEAVGRLAGGIAHDFNNMLMAIVGYASLGRELAAEGSEQRYYGDQVLVAAEKATDLTRQILAFSRKQVMSPAPVDVNGIILGLGKIIGRLLGEDIEVSLNLTGAELVALADRAQIEQVLMNLATNARDAMPAGGRLVIGTQAVACDAQSAATHGLEQTGRHALITVSDTGSGIDEETRQRIFEPFFTTKELGKGTGLGLSIVYGIVKQHHGQISVYSEVGRGTTFRIYLPLTESVAAEQPAGSAPAAPGGTETVLLAEDNEDVRGLASRVLGDAGYRVLAARDGAEAVRLFAEHEAAIDLCLLDVVMPRRSGREALEEIRKRRPLVRAIFMSGYAADILDDPAGVGRGVALLSKPLLPQELLRKVRETLDA
jgi:two-component system NtrC family sensor kinase